jgi:hypothetical protein
MVFAALAYPDEGLRLDTPFTAKLEKHVKAKG